MKLMSPSIRSDRDNAMLPLINIVFLLMIFFMLVGAVSFPAAFEPEPLRSHLGIPAERERNTLLVSVEGPLALGDQVFSGAELQQVLADWKSRFPERSLRIRADARMPAERLIEIMSVVQSVGVPRVQWVTRRHPP